MSLRSSRPLRVVLGALALAVVSCDRPTPLTAPVAALPAPGLTAKLNELNGGVWQLLSCPAGIASSARGVIGPAGGALATAGYRIEFPAGAVGADQEFVLEVLPGEHVSIEAHAVGRERFDFAAPVTVTMDIKRCGQLLPSDLHVWHVNATTGALAEDMGGVLDAVAGKMHFRTPHFSGYTIAWRSQKDGTDSVP